MGHWSVSESALAANAQYTVEVTQTDGAGNSGSSTATFVIDDVAPTVALDTPDGSNTTPTFSGTAGTATGKRHHECR